MLTHVKELIAQNAEKLISCWPNAPLGIWSASLGRKRIDAITFAGIQSLRGKAEVLGKVDLIIVDECHLIGHQDTGTYRTLINELTSVNPHLRVIGLTATPWRLGHGMITDHPAIFSEIIEPTSIAELLADGYLAPLRSKRTDTALDVTGVTKRGGEYVESALQAVVDLYDKNLAIVRETVQRAKNYKHWLCFCTGVTHAENIAEIFRSNGIPTSSLSGDMPAGQRDAIIRDFKAGRLRCLTNTNVLTTGFDFPDIDALIMARPTASPVLYVQMAGRGMRLKTHTDHCLVLDFAGNIERHGPITAINGPRKSGTGDAPVKPCPICHELVSISQMKCPDCGHLFESEEKIKEPEPVSASNKDILFSEKKQIAVSDWEWGKQLSKKGSIKMLACQYFGDDGYSHILTEFFCVLHPGEGGQFGWRRLATMARQAGVDISGIAQDDLDGLIDAFKQAKCPDGIEYKEVPAKTGKRSFKEVTARFF